MTPSSLSLLAEAHPDPRDRARAVGIWAAIASAGQALGPLAGGILVGPLGWRSVFVVNLPVGLAALAVLWRSVPASRASARANLDIVGQIGIVGGLAALTFAVIEAPVQGWSSAAVLTAAVAAVLLGTFFLAWERRTRTPMIPPRLTRTPAVVAGSAVGLLVFLAYFGLLFVLVLYFQSARHLSSLGTGLLFLPMAGSLSAVSALTGRWRARVPARVWILASLPICVIGMGALAAGAGRSLVEVEAASLLIGIGGGIASPPVITAVLEHAGPGDGGIAAGIVNSSRQLGSVLGVALLGGLVTGTSAQAVTTALREAAAGSTIAVALAWCVTAIWLRTPVTETLQTADRPSAVRKDPRTSPGTDGVSDPTPPSISTGQDTPGEPTHAS